jgi:hypothetical protein
MGSWRSLRAAALAAVASVALAGCFWPVPGQGPDRRSRNDSETAIGVDTVASLAPAWEAGQGWRITRPGMPGVDLAVKASRPSASG